MEFSSRDFRAMIWYDWELNVPAQDFHIRLQQSAGARAPHKSTIHRWYREFHRGFADRGFVVPPHVLRMNSVKVVKLMPSPQKTSKACVKCWSRIISRLTKELRRSWGQQSKRSCIGGIGGRKLCARWVRHSWKEGEKKARVNWCKQSKCSRDSSEAKIIMCLTS